MINAKGHLAERYEYTPYGERTVYLYNAWRGVRGDMNGDGNVDSFDISPFTTATSDMASYHTSYPDLDGHARGDLNDDGAVDSFDIALFNTFLAGERDELESAPTLRSYHNGNGMTLNEIGHQGLMHDEELQVAGGSLVYNRARTLHPAQGRFMQRDPLEYVDGMGLYAAYAVMRGSFDPSGEAVVLGTTNADIRIALQLLSQNPFGQDLIGKISSCCEDDVVVEISPRWRITSEYWGFHKQRDVHLIHMNPLDEPSELHGKVTGPGPSDIEMSVPLAEILYHELVHALQACHGNVTEVGVVSATNNIEPYFSGTFRTDYFTTPEQDDEIARQIREGIPYSSLSEYPIYPEDEKSVSGLLRRGGSRENVLRQYYRSRPAVPILFGNLFANDTPPHRR